MVVTRQVWKENDATSWRGARNVQMKLNPGVFVAVTRSDSVAQLRVVNEKRCAGFRCLRKTDRYQRQRVKIGTKTKGSFAFQLHGVIYHP